MRTPSRARWTWLLAGLWLGAAWPAAAEPPAPANAAASLVDLFGPGVTPVDLAGALELAGVRNPELLLAGQRVVEAVALRQLAAVQILPDLNYGASYDAHTGPVLQSSGNVLKVHREALYVGAGAKAIAAGTVTVPGVVWNGNPARGIFAFLEARQVVAVRRFASRAVANEQLLRVALAYTELLRAQGRRSLARLTRDEARGVVRLTESWAKTGAGRQSDFHRAATELAHREAELREAEGQVLTGSARLAQLLNLDPSERLEAAEVNILLAPVVPDPIPLCELLALALLNRPELQERRAQVREALLALRGARVLPFAPNVFLGLSAGDEEGGSDLASLPPTASPFGRSQARFGTMAPRLDFDAIGYWVLQNGGVGNVAQIREARSLLGTADLELLATMDRVRAEVAVAYMRTHARFAAIETIEQAIAAARLAFEEDTKRIRGSVGLPIELLDSFELLARSRYEYLRAIIDYNQAQFELYVALGQPPADMLARPVISEPGRVSDPARRCKQMS